MTSVVDPRTVRVKSVMLRDYVIQILQIRLIFSHLKLWIAVEVVDRGSETQLQGLKI